MEVNEVGLGSLDVLYSFWKKSSGEYAAKKREEEFRYHYFENPLSSCRSFLIEKREKTLGAVMLESYGKMHHLHDWLEYREQNVVEKLINTFQSLTEIEGVVSLVPYFGREKYYENWKKVGFSIDERATYHLLMKKELKDEKKSEKIGLKTKKLHTPEQTDRIEELADLLIQISSRFENKENMVKSLRWEMEGDMSYYLAIKNGKAVGYSGLEEKSLFSEQTIYWIKELGIHPEERRKGLATELLKHPMNKVREYEGREIYIDTHSENPTKKLYEKLGFQIVEKMPNLIYEM